MPMSKEDLEKMIAQIGGSFGELMDNYRKGLIACFRCAHSGLYLPIDYLKMWGILYGIGLGPDPVSEVLDTDYLTPLDMRPQVNTANIHHAIQVSHAQVDLVSVHPGELTGMTAVMHKDDVNYTHRMEIILEKQWMNPKGLLKRYRPDLADQMKHLEEV